MACLVHRACTRKRSRTVTEHSAHWDVGRGPQGAGPVWRQHSQWWRKVRAVNEPSLSWQETSAENPSAPLYHCAIFLRFSFEYLAIYSIGHLRCWSLWIWSSSVLTVYVEHDGFDLIWFQWLNKFYAVNGNKLWFNLMQNWKVNRYIANWIYTVSSGICICSVFLCLLEYFVKSLESVKCNVLFKERNNIFIT